MANGARGINATTEGGFRRSSCHRGHPREGGAGDREEQNVLAKFLIPLGCWRVEDIRFAFDSSFVLPGVAAEIPLLAQSAGEAHDARPWRFAGLGDPGTASAFAVRPRGPGWERRLQQALSGRRAIAIYGLLTRDTALWEKLFSHSFGGDKWGDGSLETMLVTTDPTLATERRPKGAAVASGQNRRRNARNALSGIHEQSCRKREAGEKRLPGRGKDARSKADFQGCSEFNPLLLFSKEEDATFRKPASKEQRDQENSPNRRCWRLLFRPGSRVDTAKWPCPRADEGAAGCFARFWSDGETRRGKRLPGQRRKFEDSRDTFACRFYHRLTAGSPCEGSASHARHARHHPGQRQQFRGGRRRAGRQLRAHRTLGPRLRSGYRQPLEQ